MSLPTELKIDAHPHTLTYTTGLSGHHCDICRSRDQTTFYRCSSCDFDYCILCYYKNKPKVEEKKEAEPEEDVVTVDIASKFSLLYNKPHLADVYFLVGEEKIPAHRLPLAATSLIFEAMLYPIGSDKKPEVTIKKPIEVKIKDEPEYFKLMLQAIYTDEVELSATNLAGLMRLANKYQVEKLRVACASFMEADVTPDNCLDLFTAGPTLLGDPEFALKEIEENAEEVLQSPGIAKLPKERLLVIIKSDKLQCEEILVFKAVNEWAKAELKRQGKTEDSKALIEVAKDLMVHVRFPLMELTDIATTVAPTGVLEATMLTTLFSFVAVTDEKARAAMSSLIPYSSKERGGGGAKLIAPSESDPYTKCEGVFHAIGTKFGKQAFKNPQTAGEIRSCSESTSWSGGFTDSQLVDTLISGRDNRTDIYLSGKWFGIDLQKYRLAVTGYAMKNGGGRGLVIRDWNFEGKVDDKSEWVVLRRHTTDRTYESDGQGGFGLHVFSVENEKKVFYKQFRIIRTDSSSSLYCHRWELYGQLKKVK